MRYSGDVMKTQEYKLTCAGVNKPLGECTENELYSARAHAWVEWFDNKYEKPFNMPWCDYNHGLERLKDETGINPIEDELRDRGLSAKPSSFVRVDACFSRNQS